MRTTGIKYGIYGLLFALCVFLAMLYFGMGMDYNTQEVLGYLTIFISLSFVYFGIRYFRDRKNQGRIRFWKAVMLGLQIAAFTAVGIAMADYIYTTIINPDFFEEYAQYMRDEGYTGEIPDYGSGFMSMIMFLTVMIVGLLVSVIAALILKKK